MFSTLRHDSNVRLLEARAILDMSADTSLKICEHYDTGVLYGTFYVLLYGSLEYTITHCVYRTIELLNNETLTLYNVNPTLWGMIYDGDCTRIEQAGTNKKWENRYKLFNHLTKTEAVQTISDCLFPSSNGNIKETQIERVWQTLGIKSPMFEVGYESVNLDLNTLANGRMAVAHGRERSSVVGNRKTSDELFSLYNSVSRYCSYLIDCFEHYMSNKEYLQ